jgi:hypothetical protein
MSYQEVAGFILSLILYRIYINLMTSANPARTYVHELLHLKHPEWSETRVRQQESVTWRKMDTKQRFNVYYKLFNRRFRER